MPPRSLRSPRPLNVRLLADRTALRDAEDGAPAPPVDADLPVLRRWSISVVDRLPHLLALDDFGHAVSCHIDAFDAAGYWARRPDGSYLRLEDPWCLPLTPKDSSR